MAIKDQCEKCKNSNTVHCPGRVFNGSSCSSYQKGINLEKNSMEVQSETSSTSGSVGSSRVVTPEMVEASIRPHGWLTFFFIWIGLGAIVSLFVGFATYVWDGMASIVYAALTIYTIVAFYRKKGDAVFVGKIVLGYCVISNLLVILMTSMDSVVVGDLWKSLFRISVAALWFAYLCMSEQVKEIIPEKNRKTGVVGWVGIALLVLCFAIPLCQALIPVSSEESHDTFVGISDHYADQEIKMSSLQNGEYTDGRVAFMCPESFNVETVFNEDERGYVLSNDEGVTILVVSSYGQPKTRDSFNELIPNWRDEAIKDYAYEVLKDTPGTINGFDSFIRIEKYQVEGVDVYWRLVLLFDDDSGKACLVTGYDLGNNSYINKVLSSIRFK